MALHRRTVARAHRHHGRPVLFLLRLLGVPAELVGQNTRVRRAAPDRLARHVRRRRRNTQLPVLRPDRARRRAALLAVYDVHLILNYMGAVSYGYIDRTSSSLII